MNVSTSVNYLFIVALSTSIEVLAQIRGNNGVEIQDMVVRILDEKKVPIAKNRDYKTATNRNGSSFGAVQKKKKNKNNTPITTA